MQYAFAPKPLQGGPISHDRNAEELVPRSSDIIINERHRLEFSRRPNCVYHRLRVGAGSHAEDRNRRFRACHTGDRTAGPPDTLTPVRVSREVGLAFCFAVVS